MRVAVADSFEIDYEELHANRQSAGGLQLAKTGKQQQHPVHAGARVGQKYMVVHMAAVDWRFYGIETQPLPIHNAHIRPSARRCDSSASASVRLNIKWPRYGAFEV